MHVRARVCVYEMYTIIYKLPSCSAHVLRECAANVCGFVWLERSSGPRKYRTESDRIPSEMMTNGSGRRRPQRGGSQTIGTVAECTQNIFHLTVTVAVCDVCD